ncbi:PREDICTED: TMV resistance protein N-like [Fragaria vesca subsp. vesca]|uniref:TMV resistance protein N-like n=1 Tax=Fragaria vesca subsp. vesca TaxID=101020 RepID=UPI0002C2E8F3|nr:PREDICTED: TMV resistance protein N-like [Fragaria vesca subsp. vesca]
MVIIEEASSSPSSSTRPWKYHVFLSFRGEDTRYNFTGHLYSALRQKGITTFMDDQLKRGEEISTALIQAIELSKISIIVFSKDYASSKWCLDELVKILDCKKSNQQIVLPVFYKVDPSDIRNHRGTFRVGLAKLGRKFKDKDKVQEWKNALSKAARLSGWPLDEKCSEASVIQEIIELISKKLVNITNLDVAKHPVGTEPRVKEIEKLLGVEGREVHMVGIWGTGGIGKTTIAKAVYNSIALKFDGSCFLENVRENSMGNEGFVKLQKKLLYEILRETMEVANVARGISMIKERLQYKSVLLVLDDVSDIKQLDNLAGQCSWFGMGSRIIITTRDKQLLRCLGVKLIYKVQELDDHEALELFSMNAFKRSRPLDDYAELTERAVRYAQGLPLALTVLGSSLYGGNVEKWQAALDGFESREIKDVLQISYDGLDAVVKAAFLDIACFFKGEYREHAVQRLEALGRKHANVIIDVLIEKALISIGYQNCIWMHDLLAELGTDIVHKESPDDPGKRSRLWFHDDVYRILTENIGTRKIIGIKVELPKDSDVICFSGTTFSNMQNLRLFIYRAGRYSGVADNLPNSLRVVDWPNCRLRFLPSILPRELALLNMPMSRITVMGNGLKHLRYLTSVNLRGCQHLTEVPDLSGSPNLQRLDLEGCINLVEMNPSVGFLNELTYLSVINCPSLETFPKEASWKSMRELLLGYCPRLKNFIKIVQKMESIREVNLYGCGIKELHSSIEYCTSLEALILVGNPIRQLPSTIGLLTSLVVLEASETLIEELPSTIGNLTSLRYLKLSETLLRRLPSSIGSLTSLEKLDVSETLIEELPSSIGYLTSLRELSLFKSHIKELPSSIKGLTSLRQLKLSTTPIKELPSSIRYLTSLVLLNVSKTPIKELPSSIGCLTSLKELDASDTLIEELPSSFGDLIRLQRFTLKGCINLRNVPQSVYGGLQHLEELDLSCCPKLVTFPSRASALVSPSAESLPLMLPTNLNIADDDCGQLLFPELWHLRFEEFKLSVSDFLMNLDCVSTLLTLNLSGSSFDSLPACISNFRRLESLDLGGCKKLLDISELPAPIQSINLDDCVSLERFSELSNILQLKDTPGFLRRMKLSNCHRLVNNLGRNMVSEMAKALLNQMVSDGLAWYVEDWNIVLPSLPGIEVPKWFDSGKVYTSVLPGHETEYDICELLIKIPRTLKGKRIGLVICVVFKITQNFTGGSCGCTATFVINKELYDGSSESNFGSKGTELSAHKNVCLCLARIDFKELKVVDRVVRVIFRTYSSSSAGPGLLLKSFGVHLENFQKNIDNQACGEDLALERYRPSNSSSSDFDDEEGEAVASNIGRAMLAFLRCFGITCL